METRTGRNQYYKSTRRDFYIFKIGSNHRCFETIYFSKESEKDLSKNSKCYSFSDINFRPVKRISYIANNDFVKTFIDLKNMDKFPSPNKMEESDNYEAITNKDFRLYTTTNHELGDRDEFVKIIEEHLSNHSDIITDYKKYYNHFVKVVSDIDTNHEITYGIDKFICYPENDNEESEKRNKVLFIDFFYNEIYNNDKKPKRNKLGQITIIEKGDLSYYYIKIDKVLEKQEIVYKICDKVKNGISSTNHYLHFNPQYEVVDFDRAIVPILYLTNVLSNELTRYGNVAYNMTITSNTIVPKTTLVIRDRFDKEIVLLYFTRQFKCDRRNVSINADWNCKGARINVTIKYSNNQLQWTKLEFFQMIQKFNYHYEGSITANADKYYMIRYRIIDNEYNFEVHEDKIKVITDNHNSCITIYDLSKIQDMIKILMNDIEKFIHQYQNYIIHELELKDIICDPLLDTMIHFKEDTIAHKFI